MTPTETAESISRFDRVLRCMWPLFLLIVAADVLDGIVRAPHWMWNEARLARAFAVAWGYPLYPGQHALGPIIGTMHGPLGYLVYVPFAFLKDPVWALIAGSTLTAALYLAPLYWIHKRVGIENPLNAHYGFLACVSMVLAAPGTAYSALSIHVDALAICCVTLAAGILAIPRQSLTSGLLACSAALAVLGVFAKQTMAPVPVALALFVLLAEGSRQFVRYILLLGIITASLGTVVLLAFGPTQSLIFNVWTLATHLGPVPGARARLFAGLHIERTALAVLLPVLTILLAAVVFGPANSLRARLRDNPWLVFLFVALFQFPIALRAWTTSGGDSNHLGVVTLFVLLTATVGLIANPTLPALVRKALLVGLVLASVSLPASLADAFLQLRDSPVRIAFRYEKLHPGRAYFPMNPLAVLLADGKPTHFIVSIFDRELAGFPITAGQLSSGLPPRYQLIAYPADADVPMSRDLAGLLRPMHPVTEPGLEGWHVFARDAAALAQPSAK